MSGYRTTTNDLVELSIFQANGTQCGTTTNVAATNTTWTATAMTGDETACSIAAGDEILIKIKMTSTGSSNFARASKIVFTYNKL